MKSGLVIFVLLFAAAEAYAQGGLLDKGESGFFMHGAKGASSESHSEGFDLGIGINGVVDFTLACTHGDDEVRHSRYTAWQKAVSVTEPLLRRPRSGSVQFVLSAEQSVVWTGRDFLSSDYAGAVFVAGGTASLHYKPGLSRRFSIAVGYMRSPNGPHPSFGSYNIGGLIALRVDNVWLSVSPGAVFSEVMPFYGVAIGATFLIGPRSETRGAE